MGCIDCIGVLLVLVTVAMLLWCTDACATLGHTGEALKWAPGAIGVAIMCVCRIPGCCWRTACRSR